MAYVELSSITAGYTKGEPVLQGFDLQVEQGELLSLLGPSGCGKTTTLRTIAGFLAAQSGTVRINGKDYTNLPPNKRNIGLVFQNYALFPHLSVFDNVAYGLKRRRLPKGEIDERVKEALAMVSLQGFADRLPAQLSGGQRQRVALARAVVIEPDLLLLDEPLSNLDAKLRDVMRGELTRLQHRLGITMIYVTHDQVEALSLSSRIIIMNEGKIEQNGAPDEIYERPASAFVAHFMGYDNALTGTVVEGGSDREVLVGVAGSRFRCDLQLSNVPREELSPGTAVRLLFRPEQAKLLSPEEAGGEENLLEADLDFCNYQGKSTLCSLTTGENRIQVLLPGKATPDPKGSRVYIDPSHIVLDRGKA
ncbi:MAG: ABC transporter ATP-binding protein [Alkalispirochaetaceae bacterium]